ncbi:LLM class flavin-dependent oxidoreductase [Kocuria indica]|uniref:LLM class flavin-dependent oxidoreductase n=1 Tax=Kocuria marina subsp. indica TaxID=1049583 RepID=A0A6N9QVI0_9MICC|nr:MULTISPECIES: LLM class flavin-dependent oxidoreductase [Kocuria]MCT1615051.1 LLM class flavin-dependent oxidoreductase [Kocuria marina]NDO76697.1 LLM class flavin-dependent oxidoreductase [Kocuria indica]
MTVELGIDTFGDVTWDDDDRPVSHAQTVRNVVEQGVLADQVGLHSIGIGEHHRDDFAISAPDVVLAGIATRTQQLRLGTAVTVLSSDDPVRVYERFATLDALSEGRAEVVLGRGSFTESFPLFGYDLQDYEALFEEKLALFAALRTSQPVTWKGTLTQDLRDVTLYPPLENGPLPTWIAVGGSPQSVVRAAHYDIPLMLAIIGGPVERFAPFSDLYRRALAEFGHTPDNPVAYHSYGYVAETDEQAREEFFRPYVISTERIGAERGWPAPTKESFLEEVEHGSMAVGSPETVARKIAAGVRALGASRFDLKISTGPLSHGKLMRSIELYGTRVAPLVRDMLADRLAD